MKTASSTTNLIACAAIIAAVTVGVASGPAFGQTSSSDDFAFKFVYFPSELQSAPAAEKLLSRLEHEVRDHCAVTPNMRLHEQALAQKCFETTMKDAVSKFSSGVVAQAYDLRMGG